MCQAFIVACRVLLLKMPAAQAIDRGSIQLSPTLIQGEMADAQRWLAMQGRASNAGAGGVRHFDVSNFRDQGCGYGAGGGTT